jgi:thiosulfate/3-mercaptopyruvate sulfurtransferase
MSEKPDPMVTCAWLAERLDAPDTRVVDATWFMPADPRSAKAMYAERRIPRAVFFDIDDIADTESGLPHMLPAPEVFAARMRRLGIGDGSRIVVYDNHGVFSAARVWWTFRAMGHEEVYVLDGGFPAWVAAGFPVEEGSPAQRGERHFTVQYRADLVRDIADMRRTLEAGAPIFDARPAPRFRGEAPEPRAGLKGGHMPGATNVPSSSLVNAEGRLRSRGELDTIRRDLERFLVEKRPDILKFKGELQARYPAMAVTDELAIKFFILRMRSINPAREIQEQLHEIEREKWIQGEKIKGPPDPFKVSAEWARLYSSGWRAHRVTTIVFILEKEKERLLRLLQV